MTYSVKEIYYTLQGEGINAGKPAVFLRFSGCNFWSGNEKDRSSAICDFCDTDFVGTSGPNGGKFNSARDLAEAAFKQWPKHREKPFIVCTGGEPLLQLNLDLIAALHQRGFRIAVETNGSCTAPKEIDWITVSPKCKEKFIQTSGNELKLVFPSKFSLEEFQDLNFDYFLLSPKWVDDPELRVEYLSQCIDYCKQNPKWRLSVQQHKYWNIP